MTEEEILDDIEYLRFEEAAASQTAVGLLAAVFLFRLLREIVQGNTPYVLEMYHYAPGEPHGNEKTVEYMIGVSRSGERRVVAYFPAYLVKR
ncbi:MAG TPA: hypothetical protein VEA59_06550, partial [Patescibacteria group bacterium]|nr:hypothetical protein [Patescibacteria group bacterium]